MHLRVTTKKVITVKFFYDDRNNSKFQIFTISDFGGGEGGREAIPPSGGLQHF